MNIARLLLAGCAVFGFAILMCSSTCAQGGDGGGGGGGGGGGDFPIPVDPGAGGGGQVPDSNFDTGNLVTEGDAAEAIPDFTLETITPEIADERIQPFVGPSRENIVHPLSQNAAGGAGGGGGGFTLNRGGGGAGGLGQGGSEFGFTVPRRSLRAALRNRIVVPNAQFRDVNTSTRFQQRILNIPGTQNIPGIKISVANRRATLTGTVQSLEQKQLVERMARLEPGIYGIDNQIDIAGATPGLISNSNPNQ